MPFGNFNTGTSGLLLAYGLTMTGLVTALVHGRASPSKLLRSPLSGALVTVAGAVTSSAVERVLAVAVHLPTHGFGAVAISAGMFILTGYVGGRFIAAQTDAGEAHKRGTVVRDGAGAQRRARRMLRSRPDLLTFGGIAVPPEDEVKHFKVIGTTGTGKSTAIRELLRSAFARGDRAVIADPDGSYAREFYDPRRGDVILNPFDERSHRWDVFAEIEQAYDADQLARALIPECASASGREWRGYARTFFSAVARQLCDDQQRSAGELYRLLTAAPPEELRILLGGTPARAFLGEANERMFGSIHSVASASVAALEYVIAQKANPFSVRRWVRESRRGVLFLPYDARQISALAPMISAWLRLAIFETMNPAKAQPGADQRLWFVVDELDALGPIDGLKDALARLRKFGGRCVLGFQSIAQVSTTYGAGEAQTIVENCGNTLILRCSASEQGGTARFASRLIGQREVVRRQTSTNHSMAGFAGPVRRSKTTSEQHVTEDAVMDSEIEQLPDLAGYVKMASRPTWLRIDLERMF